jgi:capsular polysaccharide export protein
MTELHDPPVLHAWRFSPWKKPLVRRFFPRSKVVFVRDELDVPDGAVLAAWGLQDLPEALQARVGVTVSRWQLEDGFLRSVGLGADLVRPLSWVVDRQGLYIDATRPSDLEDLLQSEPVDPALRQRAARLRERIVANALTKYNVDGKPWMRPPFLHAVVLVPGQVESDASIRFGSPLVRSNLDLLRRVREDRPDAYIVYKPHPDVAAGLRAEGDGEADAARWCDEIVVDARMDQLLGQVDEVHTMTSLTGFEALLRRVPVVCWGQPFYAGWGLTDDRLPPARRGRRLTLDELVAGALIRYPRYARREDGSPCSAEDALDDLLRWRSARGLERPLWQQLLRPMLRLRRT